MYMTLEKKRIEVGRKFVSNEGEKVERRQGERRMTKKRKRIPV